MSDVLELKQGEGKWIRFTVKRKDGSVVDMSSASDLKFGIKQKLKDSAYLHVAETEDFDVSLAATGVVRANVPATVTTALPVGDYDAELKIVLAEDTDVDKSRRLTIRIKPAVIHD